MFIFLFYILLTMKQTSSLIIIQTAGIYDLVYDDLALIFYLQIENSCDHDIEVSVSELQCIEGPPDGSLDHMYLIGGSIGALGSRQVKNVTLIYPNLYLANRIGTCLIALHYQVDTEIQEIRKEINFNTNRHFNPGEHELLNCKNMDDTPLDECLPVDCSVKYSKLKSFYNRDMKVCQPVPECPPNAVYNPKSNACRQLRRPVCEADLQMIEDGSFENLRVMTNMVAYRCHHGAVDNSTGECVCKQGWITSTCSEKVYHPTLNTYHMCNIEVNTWGKANQKKLFMTILVLLFLTMAVAVKMVLAACILNWCCKWYRNRKRTTNYLCMSTSESSLCGADDCPQVQKRRKESKSGTTTDDGDTTDTSKR